MMKKIIVTAVTSVFFLAAAWGAGVYGAVPGFAVDGREVTFEETAGVPYIADTGLTMMPLRACLNAVGCDVAWDDQTKTVLVWKGSVSVEIPVGSREIYVNQKAVPVETPAVIKDGRTYLPLRAVLEAYGYQVNWDGTARAVSAFSPEQTAFTPYNINGGTTGVFSRKQLPFSGFHGIQGTVTLPVVTLGEKGDCPYVYFGFDWANDAGNAEGGFQFIEDPGHPAYNRWTVFLRQGNEWRWGENIALEQGSTHRLKFYSEQLPGGQVDLVIALDGREVVRKASAAADFSAASAKTVVAMGMSRPFDGKNCASKSKGAKIADLEVLAAGAGQYSDFESYELYREWRPSAGGGMWFGTADCIPVYLHDEADGAVSIYNGGAILEQTATATPVARRAEHDDIPGNVTVTDQYIYYEDRTGQIIQAKRSDPSAMKAVYQLPVWTYGNEEYVYSRLSAQDGAVYLRYHQGGAVMGADYLIRLSDDGTAEELQNSYNEVKILGDSRFSRWVGPMPVPGNLSMQGADGEYAPLGSADYLYTWGWRPDGTTGGGFGPGDVALRGDLLYILAYDYEQAQEQGAANPGIYGINVNTGETVRVSDREIPEFALEGDSLYYHSGGSFYRLPLGEGTEEPLGPQAAPDSEAIRNFLVLGGKIYWQQNFDQGLYDLSGKSLNAGGALDSMALMGDSGEYLVCTFAEGGTAKFRIIVFDKAGDIVFKTPDKAYCRNIFIKGDQIYFYNLSTETVCVGQLNAG
jgi:hypothetical protein